MAHAVNLIVHVSSVLGRNLLPATACLFLVWKMFSVIQKTYYGDMHIVFENVKFLRATTLADEKTDLRVSILSKSGYFEVSNITVIIIKMYMFIYLRLWKAIA